MFSEEKLDMLNNTLDPRAVNKPAPGKYGEYIEAWWAIHEANRIFGPGNWSRETVEMRLVCEQPDTPFGRDKQKLGTAVSYIAKVRITVYGDTGAPYSVVKEGTGSGHGIDENPGIAHESAAKEAESDAMKRALMQFGNPFGLALYDKTKAMVATPRETKKEARDLYESLQKSLRACSSKGDLLAWGKDPDNQRKIKTLPLDWEALLRDEWAAEKAGHEAND